MLYRPIKEISDDLTGQVVQDLCNILKFSPKDFQDYNLYEFFNVIFLEGNSRLKTEYLPYESILDAKMESIQKTGFYTVCKELKPTQSLEVFDRLKILKFLKDHFSFISPPPATASSGSDQDIDIRIIKQRRDNGTL